ncbi:HAD-IIIC family phosphatase [Mycobacterium sp. CBMA247]|nr:HAD-IIIC family phosphatase [Mycolicibacterium sp. CBMA 329]MUL86632.1 HAD-IIIC family phosphatase [Mycolicibacterium sp. CBMA 331]MUM02836.1 HAD-IIIC family phosphatase [Mycolicibacterium sp. CBMA 334]MUM36929.1 HAD-IIIC family phosphatase [Mycolicibacterium sp. CBMA 247]MUM42697.1 HAD-IIIC family phosphatase [Mycolicibacterium sp. CBMA 294]
MDQKPARQCSPRTPHWPTSTTDGYERRPEAAKDAGVHTIARPSRWESPPWATRSPTTQAVCGQATLAGAQLSRFQKRTSTRVVAERESSPRTADNGPITSESSALFGTLPLSVRRSVGRRIQRNRAKLAQGWVDRHSAQQAYSAQVKLELGDWDAYRRSYAEPLIHTLARAFITGRPEFIHIYRTERKHFLHPELMRSGGEAELRTMLAQDAFHLTQIANSAVPEGDVAQLVHGAIGEIHAYPEQDSARRAVKVAFVGDCVMAEIHTFLHAMLEPKGTTVERHQFYFSARLGVELDTSAMNDAIDRNGFDLIALSFLTFEGLPVYTSLIKEANSGSVDRKALAAKCEAILTLVDRYISSLRTKTNAPILLHGCSGLPLDRVRGLLPLWPAMAPGHATIASMLNDGLQEISAGTENVIFIDEAAQVAKLGSRRANRRLLSRFAIRGAVFHPSEFGVLMARDYARIVTAYDLLGSTKVLLVDFDNTLWAGVMADGHVVHDHAAQKLLKELKEAGILLVSVSKNDPKNIRWDEMTLSEDDFVLHKISWDTKAQSVIEVEQQLDLDPKSFVLIDDNPVERDLITSAVPGVQALDPIDSQTWSDLRLLLQFPATRQTEEASRRTAMYREATKRREATSASVDYPTMMRSLELKVSWRRAKPGDLDRVHELISRTNQFNTTSIRYGATELTSLMAAPESDVFVATLADKFGSLGIVGTVIALVSGDVLTYENVVMSCRAMGFGLESILVRKTLDAHPGVRTAIGRYVPTERNNPCADLFAENGFRKTDDEHWELDLASERPGIPDWFTIERG